MSKSLKVFSNPFVLLNCCSNKPCLLILCVTWAEKFTFIILTAPEKSTDYTSAFSDRQSDRRRVINKTVTAGVGTENCLVIYLLYKRYGKNRTIWQVLLPDSVLLWADLKVSFSFSSSLKSFPQTLTKIFCCNVPCVFMILRSI